MVKTSQEPQSDSAFCNHSGPLPQTYSADPTTHELPWHKVGWEKSVYSISDYAKNSIIYIVKIICSNQ